MPALLSPRLRLSVGTLVLRGKGGTLSLLQVGRFIKGVYRVLVSV